MVDVIHSILVKFKWTVRGSIRESKCIRMSSTSSMHPRLLWFLRGKWWEESSCVGSLLSIKRSWFRAISSIDSNWWDS
jgi:hypothetical protein